MLESAASNVSELICYLREENWHDEMCAFDDTTDASRMRQAQTPNLGLSCKPRLCPVSSLVSGGD